MSKEITIFKCRECGRVVNRDEQGDINNENGIKGTITSVFTVDSSICPYCKEDEHAKL